jgi:hypothetical protein
MASDKRPVAKVNAQKRTLGIQKKAAASKNLKKSNTRAGKAKSGVAQRKKQNAGVKDGTIKLGKNGKSYNVYDAKSGTWKRGVVKAAPKPKNVSTTPKPTGGVTKSKPAYSGEPPNRSTYRKGQPPNQRRTSTSKYKPRGPVEHAKDRGIIVWGDNSPNSPNYKRPR